LVEVLQYLFSVFVLNPVYDTLEIISGDWFLQIADSAVYFRPARIILVTRDDLYRDMSRLQAVFKLVKHTW